MINLMLNKQKSKTEVTFSNDFIFNLVTKEQKRKKLNYLRLKELIVGLGMMTEDASNSDSKERVLLYDLWKLIRGE
jgi:hypothetical protein